MRLTSFTIAVAAAALLTVQTTFALPASLSTSTSIVANGQEPHNLSDHLLATNVSFTANLSNENSVILIEQCGDNKRAIEHARNLAKGALNVARFDAPRGVNSPHGFTAMFKADMVKDEIALFINDIYEFRGLMGLRPEPEHVTRPRLACVQPNSATVYHSLRLQYDPWERCHNRRSRHPFHRNAFYALGTAYIFLCPNFLDQALAPIGNHCPTVRYNVFGGNADSFYRNYQMYQLLYQFVRFYLRSAALVPETFGWNQCVGLDIQSSIRNPVNFLLYIALYGSSADWTDSGAAVVPCSTQPVRTAVHAAKWDYSLSNLGLQSNGNCECGSDGIACATFAER